MERLLVDRMKKIFVIIFIAMLIFPYLARAAVIDSPSIEATLAYQDPDPVEPGDEVELRFSVKNTGKSPAKSTEFSIETKYPFELSAGEKETKIIGDVRVYDATEIDTGEASVKFKLKIDEDALEGNYQLILKYRTEEGISRGQWINLDPFTITIGSKGTHLVLRESTTTPGQISPGEHGALTLIFSNEGNTVLEDITVTMNLSNLPEISPVRTGTEFVIRNLAPKETGDVTFQFILAPDAIIKVYKLPMTLEYADARGEKYEKITYTSIVADAEPEYILNLEETDVFEKKQRGNIVISLSNIGVSDINYATLTMKENEYYTILSPDAVYLGNLESDDFETAQFTVYTNTYQETIPLEFVLFYKNNYNQNYEENITLQMKLFTNDEAKKYGFTQTSKSWMILVVAIVCGAVWYYWKYRRRKK